MKFSALLVALGLASAAAAQPVSVAASLDTTLPDTSERLEILPPDRLPGETRNSSPAEEGLRAPSPDRISLTVSPAWAYVGAFDFSAEYRPGNWSFLLNGMAGEFDFDLPPIESSGHRLRVGRAQVRRYLEGEGTHLAGEVSCWSFEGRGAGDELLQWRVGAVIGHKKVWRSGFTVDLQGGASAVAVETAGSSGSSIGFPPVIPTLRLNLGWSFL